MWDEFIQAPAPSQPFVCRSLRFVEVHTDIHVTEALDQLFGAHVLFRAATLEEIMHLFVETVCIGKHPIESILYIQSEDGSTEAAYV